MPKFNVFIQATVLVAAMSLTGCSDDAEAGPKAGQSSLSLRLSGGHLKEPIDFVATVDKTMSVFSSSMTFLGSGLDITGSNGTAVLKQMILGPETSKDGIYSAMDGDSDMVFRFPDVNKGYSIRPREGTGTIKIERLDGKHVRMHLDFDASPTNIGGRDLVFHIKGVFESRPKVRK